MGSSIWNVCSGHEAHERIGGQELGGASGLAEYGA